MFIYFKYKLKETPSWRRQRLDNNSADELLPLTSQSDISFDVWIWSISQTSSQQCNHLLLFLPSILSWWGKSPDKRTSDQIEHLRVFRIFICMTVILPSLRLNQCFTFCAKLFDNLPFHGKLDFGQRLFRLNMAFKLFIWPHQLR